MGKYMRKCRAAAAAAGGGKAAPAVVEHRAPVALGVRTRSRAAALNAKMRKQQQATTSTAARAVEDALLGRDGGDAAAGCYLHLRSRRLFMPASAAVDQLRGLGADEEASTAGLPDSRPSVEAAVVAGVSRCSSTASTAVDVAARERSGDEAEQACESGDVESSVSDSECGGRDRRETTPSSRSPADLSDLESSQAADEQKHKRRRYPATTTTTAAPFRLDLEARARMPPAAEIDEFFAAAEKAQAERFAAKYNFDVARGVPLNAGRFEWTPVATV
ncbi:cyclin-dependent kinase inhibitor 1-like isoform X1 [Triticum dicoccoides]|uniref:cyclin-dependent kinase inhibitor 1-like isoform X1 n=1 Tax=Triticum dicoccoides TaxID=85692 RepID=UPI00189140E2|nr:cyclin-dependent kinase inhibitor 1-like isoform X1 [Triticum dicoccoides]XP_044425378.1 cyclin-dependent kinase inhibitor 1-like isoform X1 [Triticum aestivum]